MCVQELGFPGVEVGSHIRNGDGEDWNLDHPELQCIFAVRGSCVIVYSMSMLPTLPVGGGGHRSHSVHSPMGHAARWEDEEVLAALACW